MQAQNRNCETQKLRQIGKLHEANSPEFLQRTRPGRGSPPKPLASSSRLGRGSTMRLRILFGTLVLVVGLALYAAAVAVVVRRLLPGQMPVDMAFYAVAGVIWILPAAWLTRWMNQAEPHRPPGTFP
jgi:Protein of unknown function (DUF2842)